MSTPPNANEPLTNTVVQRAQNSRLLSLDAYRGLVMLLLAFTAAHWNWTVPLEAEYEDSTAIIAFLRQFEHVQWEGMVLWDLIQPAFMFMVGVSMAYSYISRERQGHSFVRMFAHACYRALVLILLGVFLRSLGKSSTYWTFEDVVTQIGLGYVPLFLLWKRPWQIQLLCAVGVLMLYWCLFAFWPLPGDGFLYGTAHSHEYYQGFFAHWNMNTHPGHRFDTWFLNLFPRETPFDGHPEGYNTLNFVPSLATMIAGLMAGEFLRGESPQWKKVWLLLGVGITLILLGTGMHLAGICPVVKKTWTPAFGLLSTGVCLAILALLYAVIDVLGVASWAWPAVIVGRNSIAMYCLIYMTSSWLMSTLHTHVGTDVFHVLGSPYQRLLENLAVGTCLWVILYWMNRRQIFLRI